MKAKSIARTSCSARDRVSNTAVASQISCANGKDTKFPSYCSSDQSVASPTFSVTPGFYFETMFKSAFGAPALTQANAQSPPTRAQSSPRPATMPCESYAEERLRSGLGKFNADRIISFVREISHA